MKLWITTIAVVAVSTAVTGCGTTASFTRSMEEPVKALSNVVALADEAEQNVLKATATGLAPTSLTPGEIACRPVGGGPGEVSDQLKSFGDALDIVRKIGEKPADTSYAGYIRKFRENAAAGQPSTKPDIEKRESERFDRCKALFLSDINAGTQLSPLKPKRDGEMSPSIVVQLLGVNQLAKAFLGQAETISREAAVRRAIEKLLPDLRVAAAQLKAEPSPEYGPLVQYGSGSSVEATVMNASVLGATVNVRRWYVAQQVKSTWDYLARCRAATDRACFGDPAVQAAADRFASTVYAYRSLAKVDPVKVLASVDSAVITANDSLNFKEPEAWIDGLIGIADALSSLNDAYGKFDKSKD